MLSRKLLGWIGAGVVSAALVPAGFAHVRVRHTANTTKTPAKTLVTTKSGKTTVSKTSATSAKPTAHTANSKTASKVVVHKTSFSHTPTRKLTSSKPVIHKTGYHKTVSAKPVSHHLSTTSHHTTLKTTKKTTLTSATKRPVSHKVVKTTAVVK